MENQRIKLTKRLLRTSLISLLKANSIHKISIRELCENAGINRSTFYKYYGSQYDLLEDIEEEMIVYIEENIVDYKILDIRRGVEQITALFNYFEENAELVRLLVNNNVDPDFPQRVINLPQIRSLVDIQLGSKYTASQAEYIFTFIVNGGFAMLRNWINKDDREPSQELASLMFFGVDSLCSNLQNRTDAL